MNRVVGISIATVASLGIAVMVAAQPKASEAEQPPARENSAGARAAGQPANRPTRDNVEAFIRRRLEDLKRREMALEGALKRLESGGDPGQIRDELQPPRTSGRAGETTGERRPEQPPKAEGEARQRDPAAKAAERQKALAFLQEFMPRMGERLGQLRSANPEMADRLLDRLVSKIDDLRATRAFDEEMFRLKVDELGGAMEVMRAHRALSDAVKKKSPAEEVARLKSELRVAIGSHFDQQIKIQERDAEKLAERIERLRGDISRRRDGREALIDHEIEAMTKRGGGAPQKPDRGG